MKYLTETYMWDQILRDAVEHRTLHQIYYEAGYREGVRDTERRVDEKPIGGNTAA